MEVVYVYQRKRKDFGRQAIFHERPAELTVNIAPDSTYMANYVVRNPCHSEVQRVPDMSEHEANTESLVTCNRGILHQEGGWPKDVDPNDVEHTLRYRKKFEKDEDYAKVIKGLSEVLRHDTGEYHTGRSWNTASGRTMPSISTRSTLSLLPMSTLLKHPLRAP